MVWCCSLMKINLGSLVVWCIGSGVRMCKTDASAPAKSFGVACVFWTIAVGVLSLFFCWDVNRQFRCLVFVSVNMIYKVCNRKY
ncbi:unnamed protein product [Triticum turgidum subsp. durum]|uniref:Uncharacterized protein n=1 Tax=Triticum turgidum subsp. durum TaxID=4567 RepID=A0A9R0RPA4_TRITD|nr:unnamed protein product [Triticum turgidum subsp. durum]